MKRVLIVSPYFPPGTLAGVHRARILANHLSTNGWDPIILCVHEKYYEHTLDHDLAALVSTETRVVKVGAWPTKLSRMVGLGDVGMRGYFHLRSAVHEIIRCGGADLLFVTALPGFPLLLGPGTKQKFGIPFIADFQDPWPPQDYRAARPPSKLWASHRIARLAEPYVLRAADHVTSVSKETNDLIRFRHPWMPKDRFSAIPIGGDVADFDYLFSRDRPCRWFSKTPNRVTFAYVGNIWKRSFKTLEAIFAAVARLQVEAPQIYDQLRFLFVGTSNQPVAEAAEVVMPFARRAGISDIVKEEPRRIPYLDALNIMVHADFLLMVGSDEPHYTASKLYPVLLARRPVLAVFHEESSVCSIAEAFGGVRIVRFNNTRPVETTVPDIVRAIKAMVTTPADVVNADHSVLAPYLGPAIAKSFSDVFDRVIEQKKH